MCKLATKSFGWDSRANKKFRARSWRSGPARSRGKSRRALAAGSGAFTFNDSTIQRFNESTLPMFQIIFNELSAAEISALPKSLQLNLLAEFQILPEDLDHLDNSRFGVI